MSEETTATLTTTQTHLLLAAFEGDGTLSAEHVARRPSWESAMAEFITMEPPLFRVIGIGHAFSLTPVGADVAGLIGDTYGLCYFAATCAHCGNPIWVMLHRSEIAHGHVNRNHAHVRGMHGPFPADGSEQEITFAEFAELAAAS